MAPLAIAATGLEAGYGAVRVLAGVDLAVDRGTTLAILGHNGAGKTTLVRTLTTLLRPTGGRASIDGFDVVRDAQEVRRRIGVTGQFAGLDDFLTGRENLDLVARLAGLGGAARRQADALIERLDLGELAHRRVGQLSGGSRRRIDLAASLVGSPSVLFLDEPTTGLDPTARAGLWDVVGELTAGGTTVLLTTQYLEEADRLADEVVVVDHGCIAAQGTTARLKALVGGKAVVVTVPAAQVDAVPFDIADQQALDGGLARLSLAVEEPAAAAELVSRLHRGGVEVRDLEVSSPTLDDVFAHLSTTGAPA